MEAALKLFTLYLEDENFGRITAIWNFTYLSFYTRFDGISALRIRFIAKRGITGKTSRKVYTNGSEFDKNKNCTPTGEDNSWHNIRCSTMFCINCISDHSKFSLENVKMIAKNVGECCLLQVSTRTVIVYKDLNTFPNDKFLRKLKYDKQDIHAKYRNRDGLLIYIDTDGTLRSVTRDCIFSKKLQDIASDTTCSVWFDTLENKFIETESHDEKPAKKRQRPERTNYNQKLQESNRKRRCHCVCQSRPISLNTGNKKTKNVDEYGEGVSSGETAPLFETSFNNDSYPKTPIAQASDESTERTICPSSFPNSITTDDLSGFSCSQQNIVSSVRNGRRYCNTAYTSFIDVEARRASFTSAWPHSSGVQSTEDMVQNGFFFTGNGDLIRCYQCGIGLKDWGHTDAPLNEHVRYSPSCQYIVDVIPPTTLRAIKASFLPNNVVSTRESARIDSATQATNTVAGADFTNEQLVLPVHPRNPQYVESNVRISSFSKWPRDITQTPEELAEAGFFYTGCNDIVRCFACDGGLQKWSPGDSAWVEHARWFPHCSFVRVKKGEDFIELVRLSAEQDDNEEAEASEGAGGYTAAFEEAAIGGMNHLSISDRTGISGIENFINLPECMSNFMKFVNLFCDYQKRETYQEDTEGLSDIKKAVREAIGCSEETVTKVVRDMTLRGQRITQDTVANYVLEGNLHGPHNQSDYLINFQKEPKSFEELIDERKKLRSVIKCQNCADNDANCLFLPCAHHRFCVACSKNILICPVCQQSIKNKVKTFMS